MADWTDPPYTALVAGKAWTDAKAQAAFENAVALAEGATGAPHIFAAWHPFNGVLVGDAGDGLLWSFARDGGVASITSPDFEDGFEYRLLCHDLGHNQGSNRTLLFEAQRNDTSAWVTFYSNTTLGGGRNSFVFDLPSARLSARVKPIIPAVSTGTPFQFVDLGAVTKIKAIRATLNLNTFVTGAVYLQRRLAFL